MTAARIIKKDGEYIHIALEKVTGIDPDSLSDYFGVFRSRKHAIRMIWELGEKTVCVLNCWGWKIATAVAFGGGWGGAKEHVSERKSCELQYAPGCRNIA